MCGNVVLPYRIVTNNGWRRRRGWWWIITTLIAAATMMYIGYYYYYYDDSSNANCSGNYNWKCWLLIVLQWQWRLWLMATLQIWGGGRGWWKEYFGRIFACSGHEQWRILTPRCLKQRRTLTNIMRCQMLGILLLLLLLLLQRSWQCHSKCGSLVAAVAAATLFLCGVKAKDKSTSRDEILHCCECCHHHCHCHCHNSNQSFAPRWPCRLQLPMQRALWLTFWCTAPNKTFCIDLWHTSPPKFWKVRHLIVPKRRGYNPSFTKGRYCIGDTNSIQPCCHVSALLFGDFKVIFVVLASFVW